MSAALILVLVISARGGDQPKQTFTDDQRGDAQAMLKAVADQIRKKYYDPGLRGSDFEARVPQAVEKIKKAQNFGEAFTDIAWVVDALNDSHTTFIPPERAYRIEPGWQATYVGDQYLVTAVRPGSDAEAKGLKVGDEILAIDGLQTQRAVIDRMNYYFYALFPRGGFKLMVRSPGENPRVIVVMNKVVPKPKITDLTNLDAIYDFIRETQQYDRVTEIRYVEAGPVLALKLPNFELSDEDVQNLIDRIRKYNAVVLDLRGNPGGYVDAEVAMLGAIFDHPVTIADVKGRKPEKQLVAKPHGKPWAGKMIVLLNSKSASAAEIFARVLQLEKRGVVYGDQSSGSVMQAQIFPLQLGVDTSVLYAVEVTNADLLMADGKSLEHVGVTPDKLILPTAEDVAAQRDPVLAQAINDLGGKATPESAGKCFPVRWPKN